MKPVLKRSVAFTLIFALSVMLMLAFGTTEVCAESKTHLKKSSLTMMTGTTYQQKLITSKNKVINASKVKWSSNNYNVAKVTKSGKVTAISIGTAMLRAKYKGKSYSFKVKVKNSGYLQPWPMDSNCVVGGTMKLELWGSDDGSVNLDNIKWESSNEKVLMVNANGTVTGVSVGSSTVYATYGDCRYAYEVSVYKATLENLGTESFENMGGGISAYCNFNTNYAKGMQAEIISGGNLIKQIYPVKEYKGHYAFMVSTYSNVSGQAQVKVYMKNNPDLHTIYILDFKSNGSGNTGGSVTCITTLPFTATKGSVVFTVSSLTPTLSKQGKNLFIKVSLEGTCSGVLNGSGEGYPNLHLRVYDSEGYLIKTESVNLPKVHAGDKLRWSGSIWLQDANPNTHYTIEMY